MQINNVNLNATSGAGATPPPALTPEMSGWIEAIYYAMNDLGSLPTNGTATPSETLILQLLSKLTSNPEFTKDLSAAAGVSPAGPANPWASDLYKVLNNKDSTGNSLMDYFTAVNQGGAAGATALAALQADISDPYGGSLLGNLNTILSNDNGWNQFINYQFPGTSSESSNFATQIGNFITALGKLNSDMTNPPNWSTVDQDAAGLLSAFYGSGGVFGTPGIQSYITEYPNDGFVQLLNGIFSLQPAGSNSSLESFMASLDADMNATPPNVAGFQALLMNTSNLQDPGTLYNLLFNKQDGSQGNYDNSFYYYLTNNLLPMVEKRVTNH